MTVIDQNPCAGCGQPGIPRESFIERNGYRVTASCCPHCTYPISVWGHEKEKA